MKNIAIFASGSGTNAENIARYFTNSENVNVAVVLSNNRNEKMLSLSIDTFMCVNGSARTPF